MNFSRNKILANLGHKPWNANVRWIEESPDADLATKQELLNLYIDNSGYKKFNKYLRADNHETGMMEIINEGADNPEALMKDYISKIPEIENALISQLTYAEIMQHQKNFSGIEPQPLTRGLRFETEQEQQNFLTQLALNKAVRWDGFTSATTNPKITNDFSISRASEYPVKIKFQEGNYGSNNATSFDANNYGESEYIYPPGTYFTAVAEDAEYSSKLRKETPIIVVEATKQHPRVASILSNLRSPAANAKMQSDLPF